MSRRWRGVAALVLLVALAAPSTPSGASDAPARPFCDLASDAWYEAPVAWAKSAGVTTGVSPTEFDPNGVTTRGQVVTMLHRYATWRDGEAPPGGDHPFADVDPGAFFSTAVGWAANAGISTGVSPDRFEPSQPTTRAQLATFLHRLEPRAPVATGVFDDVPAGSWFDVPIHWMWHEDITTGTSPGRFSPNATSTRAELITFLWRLEGRPEPGPFEPAPCPRRFTVVGDSVVWGTRKGAVLTSDTYDGWIGTIDAAGCRQPVISAQTDVCGPHPIPSAVDAIENAVAFGTLGDVVIVHTGTNGELDDAAVDVIVGAVPPETTLWLMTIQTPFGSTARENAAIRAAIERWSPTRDVRLLDWAALATTVPGLLDRDGVHLTEAGRIAMRDLIGSALDAS